MKYLFRSSVIVALVLSLCLLSACEGTSQEAPVNSNKSFSVAVYVPGVVEGSPTYEMMVDGVTQAMDELRAAGGTGELKILEGGFNQGEWLNGLIALAATGTYDLIVSSNPSMPAYAEETAKSFPNQKFLCLDGSLSDNKQIKSIAFDQYQQAWLNGYFAGLITSSTMAGANPELKIGLLAGQEYPLMNEEIRTGFLDGAKAVNPGIELDFRVLGNWYDAAKAETMAKDMIARKVDVILTIAGGGNQGVIAAAKSSKTYVTWFDSPGYALAPGVVVGSTLVRQTQAAKDAVLLAAAGKLDYGVGTKLGIAENAVSFDLGSPEFKANVHADIAKAQEELISALVNGSQALPRKP